MAKDPEAWDKKDPNYKAGQKLGKAQKNAEETLKKTQGKGGKK